MSAQGYYGEQEHPTGHRKKHHQQQYEGEEGPGSQFENRSNEGGAYGGGGGGYDGGGGYGGPPEFPQAHQRPPRDEYSAPQSEQYGGGRGGYGDEYERPRPSGEGYPEHAPQHHQKHHPGGQFEGGPPSRLPRGEYEGEYNAPPGPPQGYGNRPGQGYASGGGGPGYGQGRPDYEGGGYGAGQQHQDLDADAEYAKKLDADLNHGGTVVAEDGPSGQQYLPPQGPPGGQHAEQPYHPPQGPPGGQYGGQQYHPPQGPPQSYAHIPALAAEHDEDTDPEVYHQAAQKLHRYQSQQHAPTEENEESFNAHMANHAQAYGPNADHSNMDADAIGSAAAMEALRLSGGNQNPGAPAQQAPAAHANTSQATSNGGYPAYPSSPAPPPQSQSSPPPQSAPSGPEPEEEASGGGGGGPQDFLSMAMGKFGGMGGGASPSAGGGGSSGGAPQDKLVALAMAQAGKLFDKKNGTAAQGANQDAKAEAMKSAAATAMRLAGQYKTTGKFAPQSGDMQQLMGAFMSFLK